MALGNPSVMYDFISHPYMAGNRAVYSALAADLAATPQQCQRVRAVVQEHAATMRQLQASEQQLLSSMQVTLQRLSRMLLHAWFQARWSLS